MRLTKTQITNLVKEVLKERVELYPSGGVDEDNVSEAMKDVKQAMKVFEGHLKLYLEHDPMRPDSYTGIIKKLQRANVEYVKLLNLVAEKVGLDS